MSSSITTTSEQTIIAPTKIHNINNNNNNNSTSNNNNNITNNNNNNSSYNSGSSSNNNKNTNRMTVSKVQSSNPKVKQRNITDNQSLASGWKVKASDGALNTSNPIREIIETMNLAENPKKKVIPLSIGDPTIFGNLKPCQEILDALHEANTCGKYYGYQVAAGMESARDAVADYYYRCTGNKVKRQDVILASGCSHAIDLCICVLAQSGQNILIPRPGFPLYKTLTSVYGIQFKQYNLIAEKNWSIDLNHMESLIDDKTAAIVINNPSNPCGSVFSKRHLLDILKVAEKHYLPIISDEIYDKFVFSPEFYTQNKKTLSSRRSSLNIHHNHANNTNFSRTYSTQTTASPSSCVENLENHQPTSPSPSSSIYGQDDDDDENCMSCREDTVGKMKLDNGANGADDDEVTNKDNNEHEDADYEDEGSSDSDTDDDNRDDDGLKYVPFRSLSTLSKVVPILTCGGISKTCLIPGLRLGWIIINDRANIFDLSVRNGMNRLTQRLMGPNSLVQGALHNILTNVPDDFYKQTMDFIFRNAKLCYDRLKTIQGLHPYMPQGSMYLMVKFNSKCFPDIDGDLNFTSKLMNEESVLVLPGSCFDFPNYFRICLTVPTNVMEEALIRICEFCERHYYNNFNSIRTKQTSIPINDKGHQQQQLKVKHEKSAPVTTLKSLPDHHRSISERTRLNSIVKTTINMTNEIVNGHHQGITENS